MSKARDISNLFSVTTDVATDAEVTSAIANHAASTTNRHYKAGDTASRPASPTSGDLYSNTQTGYVEIYTGSVWSQLGVVPAAATIGTAIDVGTNVAYGSGSVDISFTASNSGGLASTFTATSSPSGITGSSSSSPVRVTGLTQGTAYTFTIMASNGYGNSVASSSSNSVTPTSVPQSPTIGSASTSNSSTDVTVTWTLGSSGGKNLTSITITPYLNGVTAGTPQNASSTSATSHTFTGLTALNSYTFKVKAVNDNGSSIESSATNSVTIPDLLTVDYLILAGGGGGGNGWSGGGGGAGGLRAFTSSLISKGTQFVVTVGAGGSGAAKNSNPGKGSDGNNSSFSSTSVTAGGAGTGSNSVGNPGGSGGGGSPDGSPNKNGGTGNAGNYSPVEGYAGGNGSASYPQVGPGGGGAGAVGASNASNSVGGAGGVGVSVYNSIDFSSWLTATSTGSSGKLAGGGGGGTQTGYGNGGAGGTGGGGTGATGNTVNATNGTANTGGGGGGFGQYGVAAAGNGGSGIVILRTAGTYTAAATTGSPTRTVSGSYTYYVWTGSGSITP